MVSIDDQYVMKLFWGGVRLNLFVSGHVSVTFTLQLTPISWWQTSIYILSCKTVHK